MASWFSKKSSSSNIAGSGSFDIIAAVGSLETVTEISLPNKKISDRDIEILAKRIQDLDAPPPLHSLRLVGNNITAASAPYIVALLFAQI